MRMQLVVLTLGLLSIADNAIGSEVQAESFANIYASLCMKHLMNLDELRAKLKQVPKLPPEKSGSFLQGQPGDVWSVPDKHGTFVVALPHQKNQCTVYARRANAGAVERRFIQLVATAPSPLTVRLMGKEQSANAANGPTQMIAYEWTVPEAPRKMRFMLTTAVSEAAPLHAMATATVIDTRR